MIRRIALLFAAVGIAVLTSGGVALASTTSPSPAPLTQCNQLQFLGPDAVAACNLGPPSQGVLGQIGNLLNPGNGANNTCQPGLPMPESAAGSETLTPAPAQQAHRTLYASYGTSGLFWAPFNLQCSQWEDLLGNSWANFGFSFTKTLASVTLAMVHMATTPNLLNGIQGKINAGITVVGGVAKQWLVLVIAIGGIYMAWALFKGRGREVLTSIIHMVIMSAALLFLVLNPGIWTGLPAKVVNISGQVTSQVFSAMPSTGSAACLPAGAGDPQSAGEGSTAADHGEDAIWSYMVCKPWLAGEFSDPALQHSYGRALLWSQSFAQGEQQTADSTALKKKLYGGIDNEVNQHHPGAVDMFEGNLWQQRIGIALFATLMDLVLAVLFIALALTLVLAQVVFYLLMLAAPVVLLIGVYPGAAGKDLVRRWLERMLGLLAKTALATVMLSASLWVFGLIAGLGLDWISTGALTAALGVFLIVKRKTIVSGKFGVASINKSINETATNLSNPVASAVVPKRVPPVKTERTVFGTATKVAAGYEAGRHHGQGKATKVSTAAKVTAAYASGGGSAAATTASGLVHGGIQKRKAAKQEQAAQRAADAAAKEQQYRDGLDGKVHKKAAEAQLGGEFPNFKEYKVTTQKPRTRPEPVARPEPTGHQDTVIKTVHETPPAPKPPVVHHEKRPTGLGFPDVKVNGNGSNGKRATGVGWPDVTLDRNQEETG